MGDMKVEGAELKKLVKLGKRRELNFAFCPGDKDDHTVIVDKRKKPEILGKAAKKEGGGSKYAFGTFTVEGKDMMLKCTRAVPAMARKLKKYMKAQKIQVNIVILDSDGNVIESDIEDLPDDPSMDDDDDIQDVQAQDEAPEQEGSDDQLKQDTNALATRLKEVQPKIAEATGEIADKLKKAAAMAVNHLKSAELEAADKLITMLESAAGKLQNQAPKEEAPAPEAPGMDARALAARITGAKDVIGSLPEAAAAKLMTALGNAAKLLKGGDLPATAGALEKIEAAINKLSTPPDQDKPEEPSPFQAKWRAAEARLQPEVDRLMQEKRGDLDAINRAFNYAKEKAEAGEYESAFKAAARVAKLVKEAADMDTTEAAQQAEDAIPVDVVPFVQSRQAWIETRGSLRKQIEGLKAAIESQVEGIEGLEDVPARTGVLFDHFNELDSSLEDTLEKLVETADGPDREKLKVKAGGIIQNYRGVLSNDFFQAVDNNGFTSTNIRAAALESLQKVSDVLAA